MHANLPRIPPLIGSAVLMLALPALAMAEPATTADDGAHVVEFTALNYAFDGPGEIPSGWVTFRMPNPSNEAHVLVLIKLPEGISYADWVDAAAHREATGEEAPWRDDRIVMGGPGALSPGLVGQTTVKLSPGQYVMVCGVQTAEGISHTALGMHRGLIVLPQDSGAAEPETDVTLSLRNHEFELEGEITAGRRTVRVHFEQQPELPHDVHVARLEDNQTREDVIRLMQGTSEISNWHFIGGAEQMPEGHTAYFTADFEPGRHAWACHYHADKGMVEEFMVER